MSEAERGDARAQGALAFFLEAMGREMDVKQRSPEYREQFFRSLRAEMGEYVNRKDFD